MRDDRIAAISAHYPRPEEQPDPADQAWIDRYWAIESHRSQPEGFWTISASPEAAAEATELSLPLADFESALMMSDGVSALRDEYELHGWGACFDEFVVNPMKAVESTWQLEEGDADCRRWPR